MNNRQLQSLLAKRFMRSKKNIGLISFNSYVSLIGVAIGVFALVVSLSVLNGFESEVSSRILEFESGIRITAGKIQPATAKKCSSVVKSMDENAYLMPYVIRKALLVSGHENTVVRVKAANQEDLISAIPLNDYMIRGEIDFRAAEDYPGIVLGFRVADRLSADLYDTISVVSPLEIRSSLDVPPVQTCIVTGIFRSDILDYDEAYAFMDLNTGQRLFRTGNSFNGIDIFLSERKKIPQIQSALINSLGGSIRAQNWRELHKDLYGAMRMEKWGTFFALTLIVIVASFNMVSGMIMMIMDRISEIGILKTMGLSKRGIENVFLKMGYSTGITGMLIGMIVSLTILVIQEVWQLIPLPGDVYFITYLPVVIKPIDIFLIALLTGLIIYAASRYPAKKAGALKPIQAIYFEK